MMKTEKQPKVACIAYDPETAAIATGRSRTRIFLAIKNGELVAKKDGKATIIEADELKRWVQQMPVREVRSNAEHR